ncbi:hypothetical protein [uncultured Zoogloea sp.]|uniref:hypothetical protein n=1 Tax=uncultured Zoogloea sp. TaxID=160237 RepID=UPI00262483E7|nr:hypothetical protein [uncultured Zoogloea sp.]
MGERYLLASTALSEYIDYVEEMLPEDARGKGVSQHVDDWHRCMDVMKALRQSEAGIADAPVVKELPQAMRPLQAELQSSSGFMRGYGDLPTRIALVDLHQLVVYQPHVVMDHVNRLCSRIAKLKGPAALFRFCQGSDQELAPLSFEKYGEEMVVFRSPSKDLRYLEPLILQQGQTTGYMPTGKVGAILGLAVGFGSNLLNAIEYEGRLLLNNGYHRATALANAGMRFIPCVIQSVRHPDEFGLAGTRLAEASRAFYFSDPRPPMLKDFIDPRLYRDINVVHRERRIVIRYQVSTVDVAI